MVDAPCSTTLTPLRRLRFFSVIMRFGRSIIADESVRPKGRADLSAARLPRYGLLARGDLGLPRDRRRVARARLGIALHRLGPALRHAGLRIRQRLPLGRCRLRLLLLLLLLNLLQLLLLWRLR